MSLSLGIVGLPNAGKSTLFNALLKRYQAKVDAYPFTTIDPNVGIVEVPDERLKQLAAALKLPKQLPATIEFVDIAGLVPGAHQGAGLGNQFLSHIRAVSAIIHVVRGFAEPASGESATPVADYQALRQELGAADQDKQIPPEQHLASKPELAVLNSHESQLKQPLPAGFPPAALIIDLKLESELVELSAAEQTAYLRSLGLSQPLLPRLIRAAYQLLGLMTFYTLKPDQVQAWALPAETLAPEAAASVHSDFGRGFIAAEVIGAGDLIKTGSLAAAKAAGKLRTEGKTYTVQDSDVIQFKFNV